MTCVTFWCVWRPASRVRLLLNTLWWQEWKYDKRWRRHSANYQIIGLGSQVFVSTNLPLSRALHFLSLDQIILSALSINILPILDINILPVLSFSRACPHACRNAKPWGIRKILIDIIRTDDLDKIPDENRLARYFGKLHKCRLWHFSTVASQWSGVLGSADIHWRVQ